MSEARAPRPTAGESAALSSRRADILSTVAYLVTEDEAAYRVKYDALVKAYTEARGRIFGNRGDRYQVQWSDEAAIFAAALRVCLEELERPT
jgi:hypothetical protein